jgi:hypothetical protein
MLVRSKVSQQLRAAFLAAAPISGILLLFTILVLPPIIIGVQGTSEATDMIRSHLPQINTFVQEPFAIFSYQASAASTPGQHIVLAWLARALGYTRVTATNLPVRLANATFGYLVLFVVWRFLSRRETSLNAMALTLPLACSSYVVFASIWINTDNGALLFYVISVCILAGSSALPVSTIPTAILMVMWRQLYLPVVGAFGVFWLVNGDRLKFVLIPALAIAFPCLIVAVYYIEWGGLTPPGFQNFNGVGHQIALPLSALALIGLLTPFYWSYFRLGIVDFIRMRPVYLILIAAAVVALWLSGSTNYDSTSGRWGALIWSLARIVPIGGTHSIIVLMCSIIGAIVLVSLLHEALARHEFPFEIIALCLYLVGYCAQVEAFQRYIEAPVIFTFGISSIRRHPDSARICVGPLILATILGLLTAFRVYNIIPTVFG